MKTKFLLLIASIVFCTGCSTTNKTVAYSSFETQIISQTNQTYLLKVKGRGATKTKATEQAKMNAVHDLLFKNLYLSDSRSNLFPLIGDPLKEQKKSAYFTDFFAENGPYTQALVGKFKKMETIKTDDFFSVIITIEVDRNILKQRLITDGVIK